VKKQDNFYVFLLAVHWKSVFSVTQNYTACHSQMCEIPVSAAINPTTILEHHSSLKSFSSGDATGKRGGSAAESSPQAIMPCRY
jgi:hypothetical protein